jgi:hypothetical protein
MRVGFRITGEERVNTIAVCLRGLLWLSPGPGNDWEMVGNKFSLYLPGCALSQQEEDLK